MNIKSRMKYDKNSRYTGISFYSSSKENIITLSFIMAFKLFEPKVFIYSPVSIQGLPSPPSAPL